ncbi:MAG: aminotransferase class I/II-fold pyridoxal phosphate-dependent enzyme [Verrucomicrobiales bacterium]|nr:aminotransferase class I/II-fold pyridoxal phosphate-dependent enzyme [Verrucomicrobiales bacterium]
MKSPPAFIRPSVRSLSAYVPGEQPRIPGLIKLNTNENPYPPAPKVLAAIKAAVDGRLRLYPNPTAQRLREKLARLHDCEPENIIAGNGSDELLAMATRAFVEPKVGQASSLSSSRGVSASRCSASSVQYFHPSYSLYPVLADIHGANRIPVSLRADFSLPSSAELRRERSWDFRAALTYITTPNAPSGRAYPTKELETLCRAQKGVVILDEAYVDFADENALGLALRLPNVLVARTFSKAYSLCFQRVGYFAGPAELIDALDKIRDSYNVNGLGQIAAETTLDALPYYRANFRRIIATRKRLSDELSKLGFRVLPSQTNFILVNPPRRPAQIWLEELRRRKILVRWFVDPAVSDYLRITIGTDAEADALVRAAQALISRTRY